MNKLKTRLRLIRSREDLEREKSDPKAMECYLISLKEDIEKFEGYLLDLDQSKEKNDK